MQVKILFDKRAINNKLHVGWGISFLVDSKILFDTGENGKLLVDNIKQLGLSIDDLEAVAISHDHWDHTGGLWQILKRKRLRVYGCSSFSSQLKNRIKGLGSEFIDINKFIEIYKDIYLSGEISGSYAGGNIVEQAVVIKTNKGISVLTGCSHPGIVKIIETIRNKFPKDNLYLVAGGFHMVHHDAIMIEHAIKQLKTIGINKIGPTHCTGKKAEDLFRKKFKENFIEIKVGQALEI